MNFKELSTDRLILRALQKEDSNEILFLRSDKTVNAYVERPTTKSLEDVFQFINKIKVGINTKSLFYWCINIKDCTKSIGTICLWNFSIDKKTAEIGYDLHPDFHGKGIMSEALKTVLNFGFNELDLNLIEGFTHRENKNSTKLLSKFNFIENTARIDIDNSNNIIFELSKENHLL